MTYEAGCGCVLLMDDFRTLLRSSILPDEFVGQALDAGKFVLLFCVLLGVLIVDAQNPNFDLEHMQQTTLIGFQKLMDNFTRLAASFA